MCFNFLFFYVFSCILCSSSVLFFIVSLYISIYMYIFMWMKFGYVLGGFVTVEWTLPSNSR